MASSTPCLLTPQWHLISSNSPSGGMKLMLRSESNLLSRTHWWKVQSSMAIDCFPLRAGAEGLLVGTGVWQERVGWDAVPPPKAATSWVRPVLQTMESYQNGESWQPGKHTLGKRKSALLQKWYLEGTCDSPSPAQPSKVHPLPPATLLRHLLLVSSAVPLPCFSMTILSFIPNLHSGMPLR